MGCDASTPVSTTATVIGNAAAPTCCADAAAARIEAATSTPVTSALRRHRRMHLGHRRDPAPRAHPCGGYRPTRKGRPKPPLVVRIGYALRLRGVERQR